MKPVRLGCGHASSLQRSRTGAHCIVPHYFLCRRQRGVTGRQILTACRPFKTRVPHTQMSLQIQQIAPRNRRFKIGDVTLNGISQEGDRLLMALS